MKPFREWYEGRHLMPYPTMGGEQFAVVAARIAQAMADYTDAAVAELSINRPAAAETPDA